jgi:diguanylate cyclase (GGDEF)-like protein
MDIDYFKSYNDYYGHLNGDKCLNSLGKLLIEIQNKKNIYAARVGGEEFALLWFEENADNAKNIASFITQMVKELAIPHEKSEIASHVTVSMGVHITPCGTTLDIHTLYDLADKALYSAKRNGRNRIVYST